MRLLITKQPNPPLSETEVCTIAALLEVYKRLLMMTFATSNRAQGRMTGDHELEARSLQETQSFADTAFPHVGMQVISTGR